MNISDKMVENLVTGIFTIVGALLGVAGTLWAVKRGKETKRLAILVSPLGRLLGVDAIIKPRIKILYDDKTVETLFMGEFAIRNTGSLSIEPVKVSFRAAPETKILGFQFAAASFVNPDSRMKIVDGKDGLEITIAFLNKSEHISFVYFSTGKEAAPVIDASQPGLDIQLQTETLKRIPDIYAEVLLSTISQVWWADPFMRLFKPYRQYIESKQKKT